MFGGTEEKDYICSIELYYSLKSNIKHRER